MARLGRSLPIKPHIGRGRPPAFPPFFLKISGVVTKGGSPQSGVTVYLLDATIMTLIGTQTTDGSGAYSFTSVYGLVQSHLYHVAVEYTALGVMYNAKSLPYITPVTN